LPGSTNLSRGVLRQRGHARHAAHGLALSRCESAYHAPPLDLCWQVVVSVSGHGGVPPCPGTTRLRVVFVAVVALARYGTPLRGPSGLHRVLFCEVAASRCAKAPLGVAHRFAPSRVYKTHPMQSTSAGYDRTAVGAPRSHSRPTRRQLAPLWQLWRCGISQALRAVFLFSGLRPVSLCAPRPPCGLAAARHWPCAGLPRLPPRGALSPAQENSFKLKENAAGATRLRCSYATKWMQINCSMNGSNGASLRNGNRTATRSKIETTKKKGLSPFRS